MYHLRLCKALSYTGIVSATKKEPDVYTEDKAVAEKAVASGYFELVSETEKQLKTIKGYLDKRQLEEMKVDDLKSLTEKLGIDISNLKKKAELVEAIADVEVEAPVQDDENEVDYEEDEGSPTMIDLQKE